MRDHETATFWRYIAGSVDRLVGILDGLSEAELNWRPSRENVAGCGGTNVPF